MPIAGTLSQSSPVGMIHTALLIMDDLPALDDARLRGDGGTMHAVFGRRYGLLAVFVLMNAAYRLLCNPEAEASFNG